MKFNREAIYRKLKKLMKDYCNPDEKEFEEDSPFNYIAKDFADLILDIIKDNKQYEHYPWLILDEETGNWDDCFY